MQKADKKQTKSMKTTPKQITKRLQNYKKSSSYGDVKRRKKDQIQVRWNEIGCTFETTGKAKKSKQPSHITTQREKLK